MPDWSYRPIFRPLLFRLPAAIARDWTLGIMGRLGRLPLGTAIIHSMGHMQPDGRLRQTYGDTSFPSSVGLGTGIDVGVIALEALAQLGLGFIEVGPVSLTQRNTCSTVERGLAHETISFPNGQPYIDVSSLLQRLDRGHSLEIPLIVRLGYLDHSDVNNSVLEVCQLIEQLTPFATYFSITGIQHFLNGNWSEQTWKRYLKQICQAAGAKPLLLIIPSNVSQRRLSSCLPLLQLDQVAGYIVDGRVADKDGGNSIGRPAFDSSRHIVEYLRQKLAADGLIVASGGIHEPVQALAMKEAGADLVQVDSGLVYAGPGLAKRINEAMLFDLSEESPLPKFSLETAAKETWFWTALMGLAMFIGGLMAISIAATRVILPYDESFVGMTMAELMAINPNLLPFMTHDRITLAGSMIAIGWFYLLLSLFGVRRGHHWAKITILYSATAGFFSFFLFLGFSYFDPFHAFVTAILFQFMLFGLQAKISPRVRLKQPDLHNDWIWRWSLWGQILFLMQGFAIFGAGFFIAGIGITTVFVAEDLEFMQTTAEALWAANPRLVPLIAHDRATLGGMLISSGISIILATLWGFRRGETWLWWGLLLSSTIAYFATLIVHITVGYTDFLHLVPVFAGLGITAFGLLLSYPYLWGHKSKNRAA